MNRKSFIRKVLCLVGMAVLLLPLALISMPQTSGQAEGTGSPGGILARLRAEQGLSQARLGEIDPASEAIRLSTFGMRGLATSILWGNAMHYQKTKDWTSLSATLEQIILLQPNFISVWKFQGWNLSYNVSAEFDDYRQRYYWVLKGVDFLDEGTRYNKDETRLISDIGYVNGHKIGRADESRQYRRLFREDDDYHARRRHTTAERDNWLVGREGYQECEQIVDRGGVPIRGTSPLLFYSWAPLFHIQYCDALEVDGAADGRGVFGEKAQQAWAGALASLLAYGNRDIVTSFGTTIRLADKEAHIRRSQELLAQLDKLDPGLGKRLYDQRVAALSPEERTILEADGNPAKTQLLTDEQVAQLPLIQQRLMVTHVDIANAITGQAVDRARELSRQIMERDRLRTHTNNYRQTINYEHWKRRCEYEQDLDYVRNLPDDAPKVGRTVKARDLIAQADRAFLIDADLETSQNCYERGLALWREVLDAHPDLIEYDSSLVDDLTQTTERYARLMENQGTPFPQPFVLQDVIEQWKESNQQLMPAANPGAPPDPADTKPESPSPTPPAAQE